MFCGKCGAKNEEGVAFCGECGAKLIDIPATASPTVTSSATETIKHKHVGIIAVAVVVIAALLLLFGALGGSGGNSPKAAAEKFVKGLINGDGKQILNSIPDKVVDAALKEIDYTKKEAYEEISKLSEEAFGTLGDDCSISYKITEVEDPSETIIKNLTETYKEEFNITIKDVKTVSLSLTLKKGSNEQSMPLKLKVIKVGGSWYIDVNSIGALM